MIGARAVEVGHRYTNKRPPYIPIYSGDRGEGEVDPALHQVRPSPWPGNCHGKPSLSHQLLRYTIGDALWQHTSLDQGGDFREPFNSPGICDADVPHVVGGTGFGKDVSASTRENPPGIKRALVVPEDGNHSRISYFHLLVDRYQLG